MDKDKFEQLVLDILADGVTRSTQQVLAEFAAEYPEDLQAVQEEWIKQNGLSCGAIQHPLTIVSSILEDLTCSGRLNKVVNGQKLWTRK